MDDTGGQQRKVERMTMWMIGKEDKEPYGKERDTGGSWTYSRVQKVIGCGHMQCCVHQRLGMREAG